MRRFGRKLEPKPGRAKRFAYLATATVAALGSAVLAVSLSQAQTEGGPGLERRVPFGGIRPGEAAPSGPVAAGQMQLTRVFQNLRFNNPLFLTSIPGTNPEMLAVVEQDGRILAFENRPDVRESMVLLDISSRVGQGGANERGLLNVVFKKNFQETGFLYVYYTGGQGALSNFPAIMDRYTVASKAPLAPAAMSTRCEVFRFNQPQSNHNGATILEDERGALYLTLGDGGGANDRGAGHAPEGNGQNLQTPLGKILRFIPDERSASTCAINTAGNPFSNAAGTANQGGDRRIFTIGNRHTFRASFDKKTGDLWFGDVGQNTREEVHFLPKTRMDAVLAGRERPANFGWPCLEGEVRGPIITATCDQPAEVVAPVFTFPSGNQASVIGGYVYRGTAIPGLEGKYVFGDFGNQSIRMLDPARRMPNGFFAEQRLFATATIGGRPWSMGEDRQGELYAIFGSSNQIRKITTSGGTATGPTAEVPRLLSQTGLFSDTAALRFAPGVVPYDVNSKLFSDNLDKGRAFAIPGNGKIKFDAMGRFDFPVGSVFIKQFNSQNRRIETRLLVRTDEQWLGFTFEWQQDQRDAVLVGEDLKTVRLPNGQMYDLPSRGDCQACHNRGEGDDPLQIIGFQARQLNFPVRFERDANSGGTGNMDNQLRALNAVGFFDRDISTEMPRLSLFPKSPMPRDAIAQMNNEQLNQATLSFFESNCAICHRPGGNTPTPIDLQFDTPRERRLIFNAMPGEGFVDGARLVIAAGNPDNSVLLQRMERVLPAQQGMPPISHMQMDPEGVPLVRAWITRAIDERGNVKPDAAR